jgi:photosystem II stability/assembly factor-like uncharacterized protein
MRNKKLFLLLAVCIAALFALTLNAHAQIQWAKQLTPDAGWVATTNQLFWTTDAGSTWRNITPPQAPRESTPLRGISAVFFLDSSTGWVVMFSYDEDVDGDRFFLASTSDAGINWSYQRVSTPQTDRSRLGGAWLQFTDALHGIMNIGLAVGSGPGVHPSLVVTTSDGGKVWKDFGGTTAGDMLFTTQNDGWTASEDGLFVTQDGGKNWQEIAPPAPVEREKARAIPHLPIFRDRDHGFLEVEYSGWGIDLLDLFSTLDGGRTWKSDKVVPLSLTTAIHPLFSVVNSKWEMFGLGDHKLTLASLSVSSAPSSASVDANLAYLYSASFLDDLHGWALMGVHGDGPDQILSTSDAGASWTIITPPPIKGNEVGNPPRIRTPPLIWKKPSDILKNPLTPGSSPQPLSPISDLSVHLGFDISYVMTAANMQTWWNTSQYWDTNVYLPGAANRGKDGNLTPRWVSDIQTQGWGIIPTWFGAQPSTACAPGAITTPGKCTNYFTTTINPATANADGAAEANTAIAAMTNPGPLGLNFTGPIIYKNSARHIPNLCRWPERSRADGRVLH